MISLIYYSGNTEDNKSSVITISAIVRIVVELLVSVMFGTEPIILLWLLEISRAPVAFLKQAYILLPFMTTLQ